MGDDWEIFKGRRIFTGKLKHFFEAGFDGYQGGPNVVASSNRLPFSSLGSSTHPITESTVTTPGNSRDTSGRFPCSSRLTSPAPTNSLEVVEGGRHSYLPPVAPSRPPQPAAPSHSSFTTLTCLDGKVECEGGGGQEERMDEMRVVGRRERMTSSREEMMEVKLRLGKDEKRAREAGIMLDIKVVFQLL